jgi:hypothetical protein
MKNELSGYKYAYHLCYRAFHCSFKEDISFRAQNSYGIKESALPVIKESLKNYSTLLN